MHRQNVGTKAEAIGSYGLLQFADDDGLRS
jgi:hypothetical protein